MIMRVNSTVCVVDPAPRDYRALAERVGGKGARIEFMNCGRDALRFCPKTLPDLWIINMNLPDMSGSDLHQMIHSRYEGVPFYLVSDQYQTDDEMKARSVGATMYLCKPLHVEWVFARADPETN
jgi:DNA-binding response OmpR family regulator